ncbi:MAG TPA: hypothetical protein VKN36_06920 [Eudoraea sp.]|nr:hypothetical protein [Eudoraea sp.]
MEIRRYMILMLFGIQFLPSFAVAQEEESAEFTLEEYTDEFQDNFFEALKQKGIENYDKAINLLLECKRLEADNAVVDHELARAYFADKQNILAQEYALEALISEPANYWYLNTLVMVLEKQGIPLEAFNEKIPLADEQLMENLALIYFKNKNYELALHILKSLRKSDFSSQLTLKIQDSLNHSGGLPAEQEPEEPLAGTGDPLATYRSQISSLIEKEAYQELIKLSMEALEQYPTQPYFYYANGLALNKTSKPREAAEVLESGLDYLLDDLAMADKFYKELAAAYSALGNTSKANMYLSKIKSGS